MAPGSPRSPVCPAGLRAPRLRGEVPICRRVPRETVLSPKQHAIHRTRAQIVRGQGVDDRALSPALNGLRGYIRGEQDHHISSGTRLGLCDRPARHVVRASPAPAVAKGYPGCDHAGPGFQQAGRSGSRGTAEIHAQDRPARSRHPCHLIGLSQSPPGHHSNPSGYPCIFRTSPVISRRPTEPHGSPREETCLTFLFYLKSALAYRFEALIMISMVIGRPSGSGEAETAISTPP